MQTDKIYFFDLGVRWRLLGCRAIAEKTEQWGEAMEHFVASELLCYRDYARKDESVCFWRDMHQHEVDFIVGDSVAIEVKGTWKVEKSDLANLKLLMDEKKWRNLFLVSNDPLARQTVEEIHVVPWQRFMMQLWNGEVF